MLSMPRALLAALIGLLLSLIGPLAPAAKAATACTGNLSNTTISGDLTVTGGVCTLSTVTVTGNVHLQPATTLLLGGVTIKGNLTATNPFAVNTIDGGNTIRGALSINGTSNSNLSVIGLRVGGAASITGLNSAVLFNSTFGANLTVNGNSNATVDGNHTKGTLSCNNNIAIGGGGNTARGGKTGQCASL
jgi:hypothetical protein